MVRLRDSWCGEINFKINMLRGQGGRKSPNSSNTEDLFSYSSRGFVAFQLISPAVKHFGHAQAGSPCLNLIASPRLFPQSDCGAPSKLNGPSAAAQRRSISSTSYLIRKDTDHCGQPFGSALVAGDRHHGQ